MSAVQSPIGPLGAGRRSRVLRLTSILLLSRRLFRRLQRREPRPPAAEHGKRRDSGHSGQRRWLHERKRRVELGFGRERRLGRVCGVLGSSGAGSGGSGQAGGGVGGSAGASGAGGSAGGNGGSAGGSGSGGSGGAGPLGPITVWIAGDSTVATKSKTPCPIGWGGQFEANFNDLVTVVNSAVAGRSVRTWLYDVQTTKDPETTECVLSLDAGGKPTLQQHWQDMLTGMKSGDYLLIQFGINDGSADCPRHVGSEAFKTEYAMMAQAATERGAHPIFITPVSAIACNGGTPKGTRGFLTETQAVGDEMGVPVIDLHARSVALYTTLGFCPIPGGDVSASTTGPVGDFFCDDHTHFAESGAVEIAKLVAQALVDQSIGLADYLE